MIVRDNACITGIASASIREALKTLSLEQQERFLEVYNKTYGRIEQEVYRADAAEIERGMGGK